MPNLKVIPRLLRSSVHHPLGGLHVAFGNSIHVGGVTPLGIANVFTPTAEPLTQRDHVAVVVVGDWVGELNLRRIFDRQYQPS